MDAIDKIIQEKAKELPKSFIQILELLREIKKGTSDPVLKEKVEKVIRLLPTFAKELHEGAMQILELVHQLLNPTNRPLS